MVGLIDSLSMEGKAMPYTDMEGKDPYAYEVYHMNRLGIMNGYGDTFKPYDSITEEQFENRMILRNAMVRNGFMPIDCEWWHFTLENEPYPDTYFDFPVDMPEG